MAKFRGRTILCFGRRAYSWWKLRAIRLETYMARCSHRAIPLHRCHSLTGAADKVTGIPRISPTVKWDGK